MLGKKNPGIKKKKLGRPTFGDEKKHQISISIDSDVLKALLARGGSVSMQIETACKAYYLIG